MTGLVGNGQGVQWTSGLTTKNALMDELTMNAVNALIVEYGWTNG